MKKTLNLALRLFLIAAVSALILGLTNQATEPVINARRQEIFKNSYAVAYPDGVDFESLEEDVDENIKEIIEVSDGSSTIGYIFNGVGKGGYGGDISFIVGVDNQGIIQGFKVIDHSETKGYGSKIEDKPFVEGIVGTDISKGVTYGPGNKEDGEIQAISGATKSTGAVSSGLQAVAMKMSELSDDIEPLEAPVRPYYAQNYEDMFAGADKFMEVKDDIYDDNFVRLVDVFKNDEKIGHIMQLVGNGYGGDINILLGLDLDKYIQNYLVPEHTETKNHGEYIESDVYSQSMIGKRLEKNIKLRSEPKREQDILLISNATITNNAMKDALNAGVKGLRKYEKINEPEYDQLDIDAIIKEEVGKDLPEINYLENYTGIDEVEDIEDAPINDAVFSVKKAMSSGNEVGYIIDVSTAGFGGDIQFGILVNPEGVIEQFVIYKHTESEDYGADIERESYQENILGSDLNKVESFTATSEPSGDDQIQAISGATYTNDGMLNGLNKALEAYKELN